MKTAPIMIRVSRPASISQHSKWTKANNVEIEGRTVEPAWSAWCASWGILFDGITNALCGVVFYVNAENQPFARSILSDCDPRLVRLVDSNSEVFYQRYSDAPDDALFIELVWADSATLTFAPEVIDEGNGAIWFYWRGETAMVDDTRRVFGYLLEDIDWLLKDHELHFPPVSQLNIQ